MPGVSAIAVDDMPEGLSVIDVVPEGSSQGRTAQDVVTALRTDRPDYPTYVTGSAASLIDFKQQIATRLPWALALIALATMVLLFLMTGSVLVPLKAIAMNILSLGATFGALVWIFQDGHLSGLLGFQAFGAIEVWCPIVVFVFAFGLSMDYEVFLLSRIKESSGRTSAPSRWASPSPAPFWSTPPWSAACSFRRPCLLGKANWWAPRQLRRIYHRFGLRETPTTIHPSVRTAPSQQQRHIPELVA
jgi:RND superfamily putative drug exporter